MTGRRELLDNAPDSRRVRAFQLTSVLAGGLCIIAAACVITGWILGIPALEALRVGSRSTMNPNVAVAIECLGTALMLRAFPTAAAAKRARILLNLIAVLIGALTVLEYIGQFPGLNIDEIVFLDPLSTIPNTPGRMSEVTAIALIMLGSTAFTLEIEQWWWTGWLGQIVAVLIASTVLIPLCGYWYNVEILYTMAPFSSISFSTAVVLEVGSLGLLCAAPARGMVSWIVAEGATGLVLRRLIPLAIVLPAVTGWLRLKGQYAGLYHLEFGVAMHVVVNIFSLVLFIGWTATALRRLERERIDAVLALADSERQVSTTLNSIGDAVIATDVQTRIRRMNPVAERLTGWTLTQAQGQRLDAVFRIFHEQSMEPVDNPAEQVLREGTIVSIIDPTVLISKDGFKVPITDSVAPIRDADGKMIGVVLVFHDVSAEREVERQLRESEELRQQSQKMEAIGMLAGGIAHDFNNSLTVIIGNAHILQAENESGEVKEIIRSAEHAADLTRQLLAFGRQQILQMRVVDLNVVIQQSQRFIRRVLDENIELHETTGPNLWKIRADPSQLDRILVNLAINARDAMPNGGTLSIETSNVNLDAAFAAKLDGMTPGPHVLLAVSDTGAGMDKATIERIFDPFFSTREKGEWTGLGLSTVFGIVKQSEGHISVDSKIGQGTTFKIYFPRCEERQAA